MSKQQKDNPSSAGSDAAAGAGMGGDGAQGLRRQDRDDTGGPRGDALGGAVGAAAGDDPGKGSVPAPDNKGGASAA